MAERRRAERLARQLRAELTAIIESEINDPRVSNLTLTHVRLSSDLSHATVFVHGMEQGQKRRVQLNALNAARNYLRRQLSSHLRHLKRTPELRFEFDVSLEEGMKVEALLAEIEDEPTEGDGTY